MLMCPGPVRENFNHLPKEVAVRFLCYTVSICLSTGDGVKSVEEREQRPLPAWSGDRHERERGKGKAAKKGERTNEQIKQKQVSPHSAAGNSG